MEQVSVRVLNQDTAVAGELDDLIAAGKVSPAAIIGPFIAPKGPRTSGTEAGELIRQLRDEERC